MNRIDLSEVKTRAETEMAEPSVKFGTCYDVDYLSTFAKTWPAVWICGQRHRSLDIGQGYSQNLRQHLRIELIVRIVVQRYVEDGSNPAALMDSLHSKLVGALMGWTPTNARRALLLSESVDGPPHQSVLTTDVFFSTETTYRG